MAPPALLDAAAAYAAVTIACHIPAFDVSARISYDITPIQLFYDISLDAIAALMMIAATPADAPMITTPAAVIIFDAAALFDIFRRLLTTRRHALFFAMLCAHSLPLPRAPFTPFDV